MRECVGELTTRGGCEGDTHSEPHRVEGAIVSDLLDLLDLLHLLDLPPAELWER